MIGFGTKIDSIKKMLIFYCVFRRLSSRGPLSSVSSASSAGSGTSAGSVSSGSLARPPQKRSRHKNVDFLFCFSTFELARPAQLSQLRQLSRLRHLRRLSQLGQLSSASSGSRLEQKVTNFDGAYVRFGSGPPVSSQRGEGRYHQVCIFIDQS